MLQNSVLIIVLWYPSVNRAVCLFCRMQSRTSVIVLTCSIVKLCLCHVAYTMEARGHEVN